MSPPKTSYTATTVANRKFPSLFHRHPPGLGRRGRDVGPGEGVALGFRGPVHRHLHGTNHRRRPPAVPPPPPAAEPFPAQRPHASPDVSLYMYLGDAHGWKLRVKRRTGRDFSHSPSEEDAEGDSRPCLGVVIASGNCLSPYLTIDLITS